MWMAAAAALMLMTTAMPAAATVTYDFSGSVTSNPDVIFNFSLTTPSFVTGFNDFTPAQLSSCSVVSFQSFDCSTIRINSFDSVTTVIHLYLFQGNTFGALFDFGPEVFQSTGTFNSLFFGQSGNNATLIVRNNGGGGAVPEPASWAMLLTGFGAVGGALRQRRRQVTGEPHYGR